MKNILMGFALLTTLSSAAYAGDEKKAKKATAKANAKTEKCEKSGTAPSCCMKKTQA